MRSLKKEELIDGEWYKGICQSNTYNDDRIWYFLYKEHNKDDNICYGYEYCEYNIVSKVIENRRKSETAIPIVTVGGTYDYNVYHIDDDDRHILSINESTIFNKIDNVLNKLNEINNTLSIKTE